MVASDTLVGLVGAGILLVALAGVFVFESRQTATDVTLHASEYRVEATEGTVTYTAGAGTLVGGQCVPPGSVCAATVKAKLVVVGLPVLPPQTKLTYAVFLSGGGANIALGAMSPSGDRWQIDSSQKPLTGTPTSVVVSLESSATATTPSDLQFFVKSYSPPGGNNGPVDVKGVHNAKFETGSGTARLSESGGGLAVEVTLTGAKNRTGYTLRAWLHNDGSTSLGYTFLGNLTAEGTLSVSLSGVGLDAFDHLFITAEPSDSKPGRSADTTQGVAVYRGNLRGDDLADVV